MEEDEEDFYPQYNINPALLDNTPYYVRRVNESDNTWHTVNSWKFGLKNKPRCFIIFRPSDDGIDTLFIDKFQCFPKENQQTGIKMLTHLIHFIFTRVTRELEYIELEASPYIETIRPNGSIKVERDERPGQPFRLINYYRNNGFEIINNELREIYNDPNTDWTDEDLREDFYELDMRADARIFMAINADRLYEGGRKTKQKRLNKKIKKSRKNLGRIH